MNQTNPNSHLDWNAKLVRFFFGNSRLVWLIVLALLIGGAVGLKSLKREGFPAVTIKMVGVQTLYPGATSTEVESKVTREIESAVKDAKGIKDFSSVSQNSFSQVTINFDESVNIDQAVSDIQNKITQIKGSLPKEAEQPKVLTWNTGGPAFVFAITNGNDYGKLQTEAKILSDEIEGVSGVKKASFDELNKKIAIELNSDKMRQNSVTLAVVNQALMAGNVNFPAGYVEIDGKKESAITFGAFESVDDISNLLVGFNSTLKKPVYLKDIATISEKLAAQENINRVGIIKNGNLTSTMGILINVELTKDADIIKTKEKILSQIEEVKNEGKVGKDITITPVYDQAKQTGDQIKEIADATVGSSKNLFLLGGLQLLFLAMLLLVNWRAALISALSIPLAFGFTFIALAMTGTQLNTLVLFSMILVLGLIVDPAIVMIEAIQRYRDINYSQKDAVIESGRRYGASLFMAVLTSLLVFLPFGVVSGYFGEIIRYIPLTVVPALLASYFVPMALLPYLTKKMLHKEKSATNSATFSEEENLSKAPQFVMKVNHWILSNIYRKIAVVAVSVILIGLSVSLVTTGKINIVQFASPKDNAMLTIQAKYKSGTTFTEKDALAKNLEDILLKEKSIQEYYFTQQTGDGFWIYINLKDKADRKDESERSKKILARIKAGTDGISGFDDLLDSEIAMGPPQGDYQIRTQLAANDLGKLEKAAKEVGRYLATVDHITKVDDGFTGKADPAIEINLDRKKVSTAGLSSAEVGMQLKDLISETKVGKLNDTNEEIFLVISQKPETIDQIKNLPLDTRDGRTLTVGDIADISQSESINAIEHYNGLRFVSVQARVDDTKNTMATQKKLDDYLTKEKLSQLGIDSKINKGDMGDITKSFTELGIALVIAIILTYIFLVLQFKSFSLPTIMLFTIPLSFVGVFPALYLTGSEFGFMELLGITILVGIVENVAIFLIDYANQLVKEKGMTPKEAIIQASGVRFRPILLTKLVALGGLLPLAIESDMWRGLSVVIIAGIGLSGFFSLVIIPILYVSIMSSRSRIHKTK